MLTESARLAKIIKTVIKYRLIFLLKTIKSGNTENIEKLKKTGVNLRLALEELGPIFVKLGQLLSTRHDFLPLEIITELSKLQDSVKPFDTALVKAIIKKDLGVEYNQIFADFSEAPLAAASVAQVHTAKLINNNNADIVVKVLRPNLNTHIEKNIKLLKILIKILVKFYPDLKRFKPAELVIELDRVLIEEQDLLREAANASQLHRTYANNHYIYIPKVYWQYCSKNVLVLERIYGVSVNNIEELKAHHVDLKLLAKRGVELFFTQVFEHCLFHGDMHPGNIFVNINAPSSPRDPSFYAVDFGIMGTLGPNEQYYLAWNLWAFINRDYRKVAMLHIESGWVDPDTRVDVFEAAIRTVSEPILEKPLSEISFGQLLVNLFDVARSFNMQLQPQLLVFKKALINVEGIARQLDPELDLWSTARPHIEVWLKKQIGPVGLLKKIFGNMPTFQTFQTLSTALMDSPELSFKFFKVMGKQMFTKIFSKA